MIIGYARVSTTEQNLGLDHDDLKPAFDASVDQTDARKATVRRFGRSDRRRSKVYSQLDGFLYAGDPRLVNG
jgi:DNA invertase Pin-like site-specific DNA recombinase